MPEEIVCDPAPYISKPRKERLCLFQSVLFFRFIDMDVSSHFVNSKHWLLFVACINPNVGDSKKKKIGIRAASLFSDEKRCLLWKLKLGSLQHSIYD